MLLGKSEFIYKACLLLGDLRGGVYVFLNLLENGGNDYDKRHLQAKI